MHAPRRLKHPLGTSRAQAEDERAGKRRAALLPFMSKSQARRRHPSLPLVSTAIRSPPEAPRFPQHETLRRAPRTVRSSCVAPSSSFT